MENKKILIFLTRLPYPPADGTRKRILENVIINFSQKYNLEFLIITDENYKLDQIQFLENNFGKVYIFKKPKVFYFLNALLALFLKAPLQVRYFYFEDVYKFFRKILDNYDIIYVHTLRLGMYLEKLPGSYKNRIFLDLNDAISLNYQTDKFYSSSIFWKLIYLIEESRVRKYELNLLKKFKYFNVVSEYDKDYLIKNYEKFISKSKDFYITVSGYGVSEKLLLNYKWRPQEKNLVFIGNLFYPPNYDAVCFFIKNIWKKLKNRMPDFKFVVIGRDSNLKFPKEKRVVFTGFLENPYELISNFYIFISPVRFGAGIQTKIIEAMAIGIPVIATDLSLRSLKDIKEGENVFIIHKINDTDEWYLKTEFLIKNVIEKDYRSFVLRSKEYIRKNYLNKVVDEIYLNMINLILKHQE